MKNTLCSKQYARCNFIFDASVPMLMHMKNPKCQCKIFILTTLNFQNEENYDENVQLLIGSHFSK